MRTGMKALVLLAILLTGCSGTGPAAPTAPALTQPPTVQITAPAATGQTVTIRSGQSTLIDYRGGKYRFAWTMTACPGFTLVLAPTDGSAEIPLHTSGPGGNGEITVSVPAGRAYLNGTNCPDQVITVTAVD